MKTKIKTMINGIPCIFAEYDSGWTYIIQARHLPAPVSLVDQLESLCAIMDNSDGYAGLTPEQFLHKLLGK